jgi:hypothetical protein
LLDEVRGHAHQTPRVRIAQTSPLLTESLDYFAAAGYRSPEWLLHVLGRPLDANNPAPEIDPSSLVLADPPEVIGERR